MTALTLAGTLSRVITSWGGTSMVTVLRSILTILSTIGRRIKSPGPLGPPWTLPRRKITPRSYSLTTLMALSMTEATNSTRITTTIAANPIPTACNKPKVGYTRNTPCILVLVVHNAAVAGATDRLLLGPCSSLETARKHESSRPSFGGARTVAGAAAPLRSKPVSARPGLHEQKGEAKQ